MKVIQYLDFLSGKKTTIGSTCFVLIYFLSMFQEVNISPEELTNSVMELITSFGQVASVIMMTYGLVVKLFKKLIF